VPAELAEEHGHRPLHGHVQLHAVDDAVVGALHVLVVGDQLAVVEQSGHARRLPDA
jgi:hypothetical protein